MIRAAELMDDVKKQLELFFKLTNDVRSLQQDELDNMLESPQLSEDGQLAQALIVALENASSHIEKAIQSLAGIDA